MTLSAPLGRDNADYWANLYWYNERTEELEFQQAARIARDGTAEFTLDHASDYAIVIDDRSHEPVDLPFNDVPEGYWAYDAIQYVYGEGLMAGTSGSTFSPEGTTTRGQIVTILWRLSGSPVVNYLMDFDDVDPAAYYAEAIRWATSEGIAGGLRRRGVWPQRSHHPGAAGGDAPPLRPARGLRRVHRRGHQHPQLCRRLYCVRVRRLRPPVGLRRGDHQRHRRRQHPHPPGRGPPERRWPRC